MELLVVVVAVGQVEQVNLAVLAVAEAVGQVLLTLALKLHTAMQALLTQAEAEAVELFVAATAVQELLPFVLLIHMTT
jgi:hypothetical protein